MSPAALKLIRRVHMYSALFLAPWMIIYAVSGLVINHGQLVRSWYGGAFAGRFEKVGEQVYPVTFSTDTDPRAAGRQILEDLNLAGTYGVQGNLGSPRMIINRNAAFAQHRITYTPADKRLVIEKMSFTLPAFFNRAHFRHGYEHPYVAAKVWAIILDLVIVAMVFWAISGLIMWWEIKPSRRIGLACTLGSIAVFGVLLVTI